jgi:hypothetical protein
MGHIAITKSWLDWNETDTFNMYSAYAMLMSEVYDYDVAIQDMVFTLCIRLPLIAQCAILTLLDSKPVECRPTRDWRLFLTTLN